MSATSVAQATHVLYLHGFRSSPQSTKARKVGDWIARHRPGVVWWCPQLDASPGAAMSAVFARIASWPRDDRLAVFGSSLGGFYATAVAERHGGRAVLLNPAVDPARDLASAVGESTAWHSDAPFVFRSAYIDELRALESPPKLTRPERYFALIAQGDEVLSWREMSGRYAGCRIRLLEGSDHALSDFDDHLQETLDFVGLG
ncbi:MAG: YqiA/YcfP family alpha/beta fold hydrolase [Caldimonas sp.]